MLSKTTTTIAFAAVAALISTVTAAPTNETSTKTARAAACSAIGYLTTNSAGFGEGGTTYTGSQGIKLFQDGTQIGNYDICDTCSPVCSDIIGIDSTLPFQFEWGASCGGTTFNECHGAYSDQTSIAGDAPSNGDDFYGLGISTTSECKVEFSC